LQSAVTVAIREKERNRQVVALGEAS
jgi:hypothetical protein